MQFSTSWHTQSCSSIWLRFDLLPAHSCASCVRIGAAPGTAPNRFRRLDVGARRPEPFPRRPLWPHRRASRRPRASREDERLDLDREHIAAGDTAFRERGTIFRAILAREMTFHLASDEMMDAARSLVPQGSAALLAAISGFETTPRQHPAYFEAIFGTLRDAKRVARSLANMAHQAGSIRVFSGLRARSVR